MMDSVTVKMEVPSSPRHHNLSALFSSAAYSIPSSPSISRPVTSSKRASTSALLLPSSPTTIKPTTTKSHSWHDNDSTPFIKMEPYGDYNDNNWQEFRRRMDHQDESHSAVGQPFYASQPMTIYPIDYATQAGSNNAQYSDWQAAMNDLVQPPMGSPYHASYSPGYGQVPSQGLSPQWHAQQHQHQHQPSSRPTSQSYGTSPVYSIFGNVPSSYNSDNSDMEWSQDNNAGSGQGPDASAFSSVTARRAHVVEWITKTNLTPIQVQIARSIISSKWWEKEDPEPELRPDDPLITSKLINVVGGSRFKAFLDEDNGYKCTFDHDGVPCHHGKGRTERALGTIRGFFRYKPVMCNGSCGSRCVQRFVSVEQCQKHVQKKRSGRAACPDCGSAILPANMSRHRRACHSNDGGASSRP